MALVELLQKSGEADFLRAVAEAVLQILMEADVERTWPTQSFGRSAIGAALSVDDGMIATSRVPVRSYSTGPLVRAASAAVSIPGSRSRVSLDGAAQRAEGRSRSPDVL